VIRLEGARNRLAAAAHRTIPFAQPADPQEIRTIRLAWEGAAA